MKSYLSTILKTVLSFSIIFILTVSCHQSDDSPTIPPIPSLEISLQYDTIRYDSQAQFLDIRTDEEWKLQFIYADTNYWCKATPSSGKGSRKIVIEYPKNTGLFERYALLQVTTSGVCKTQLIMQLGTSGIIRDSIPVILLPEGHPGTNPDPEPGPNPDPNPEPEPEPEPNSGPSRLELPAIKNFRWFLEYKYMAMEYDTIKKHSVWMAYVLNKKYLEKNVNRKDDWKFDSRIPAKFSPTKEDFGNNGYSRGHLCPSGDRVFSRDANTETFYYSNMSPQIQNGYNGGIWGQLEDKVRSWASNCDTLYIATGGTVLRESDIIKYTTPGRMAVPKYHFKALLRRRGNSFDAIGFILEHKVYTDKISHKYSVSIDELEQRTGIDFFHNLPDQIENTIESKYEPNAWAL